MSVCSQSVPVASMDRLDDLVAVEDDYDIGPDLALFYARSEHFSVLREMNSSTPRISLRALAWLVLNGIDDMCMREEYEVQLRSHTRRRFDPFRRCERLELRLKGESVTTTVGQMNFFKWLIESGLWQFVVENGARISAEVARKTNTLSRPGKIDKAGRTICTSGFTRISGRHVVVFD